MACPVENALSHAIKREKLILEHGADQKMDYIYIDDCVEAIAAVSESPCLNYEAYNIGGGRLVPYGRVIDRIKELYPESVLEVGPGGLGYDDLGAMAIERIREDTGLQPKISIEEGVEKYARWMEV